MARFVKGDVVVVPNGGRRWCWRRCEAATLSFARSITDGYVVALDESDFRSGSLRKPSNVRPNRLFTADGSIILYRAGQLAADKTAEVIDALVAILKA